MSKTTPEEALQRATKHRINLMYSSDFVKLAALIDEVRGVDAEPVAIVHPKYSTELEQIVGKRLGFLVDPESLPIGAKLYTHPAPSQPAAPVELHKLPEPDTTHYAQWAGDRTKYHSVDQIIEFANARVSAAIAAGRKSS